MDQLFAGTEGLCKSQSIVKLCVDATEKLRTQDSLHLFVAESPRARFGGCISPLLQASHWPYRKGNTFISSISQSRQSIAVLMVINCVTPQLHRCVVAVTKFHCQPAQSRTNFQSTDCASNDNALSLALGGSLWQSDTTGYIPSSASPPRPLRRAYITALTRALVPFRNLACCISQAWTMSRFSA